MLDALSVYGPHARNSLSVGAVALGRNLMRTLPEDACDRQPLASHGRTCVIDVRLDDRLRLIRDLGIAEREAERLADSEIVLQAWSRWGEAMFDHVYGDYALILWDEVHQQMILARDALGGRPLHYHIEAGFVAVASMPKGILALPRVSDALNLNNLAMFTAHLPTIEDQTFYRYIQKVRSGEIVTIERDGNVCRRFHWRPPTTRALFSAKRDYAAELLAHLDRAVAVRLRRAEGAVAAHLSSGLDSGAVATSAALKLAAAGEHLFAITAAPSVGYALAPPAGRHGDEGALATIVAERHANIRHIVVRTSARRALIDDLDRYQLLCDGPMTNVCNLSWLHETYDRASNAEARVLLTGEMGNATLSYSGEGMLQELAGNAAWVKLLRFALAEARSKKRRLSATILRGVIYQLPAVVWRWLNRRSGGTLTDRLDHSAIRHEWLRTPLALSRYKGVDARSRPPFFRNTQAARLAELGHDRASHRKGALAGWGIDVRDPTSDRALVEFCLALPLEAWRPLGRPRGLALDALKDRLPAAILDARTRGLQAIDWHEQLTDARQSICEEIERLTAAPGIGYVLDLPRMRALLDEWPTDKWHEERVTGAYRRLLACGIAVGRFMRTAARRTGPSQTTALFDNSHPASDE